MKKGTVKRVCHGNVAYRTGIYANGECKCRRQKKSVKRIWEEETDIFGNKLLRFGYGGTNVMITGTISKEELIKVAE